MKYAFPLFVALAINWLLWSGHFDNLFLLGLGLLSCLFCTLVAGRMKILDEEGVPIRFGMKPFTSYGPWLTKEVIVSNLRVAKIVLSRNMGLQRRLVEVPISAKTELGRVLFANSTTLTPGTVTVKLEADTVLVHALCLPEDEEALEGEMGRRIREMEPKTGGQT